MKVSYWLLLIGGVALAAGTVDDEILKDLEFFSTLDAIEDASLLESAEAAEVIGGDSSVEDSVDEDEGKTK